MANDDRPLSHPPRNAEHFGQTGTIADFYRHFGIDQRGIMSAAEALVPGRRFGACAPFRVDEKGLMVRDRSRDIGRLALGGDLE
jgi:hypothetical protein